MASVICHLLRLFNQVTETIVEIVEETAMIAVAKEVTMTVVVIMTVVEVAMMQAPSTPISVLLCQNAAARMFGICASKRVRRDVGAR